MTGKELWAQYQSYTRDVTEHSRKLAFAGAAICWFLRGEQFTFSNWVIISLFFFIGYFVLDLLQGLIGALRIKFFTEAAEKKHWIAKGTIDIDVDKPRWIDRPVFWCFIGKCVALFLGFSFIGIELVHRIRK